MAGVAGLATTTPGADEAVLAQRAAGGDGEAFADLYERYEERVLNLCFRILGSQDDAADATQDAFVNVLRRLPKLEGRELAFGSYVFTSARNACYDLIERRRRTEPSDEIPEHATPMGGAVGGGGVGFDPGDPEDDPERNVLLDARTEEIRRANLMLPERQREALALKELDDLSYDEVAEIMGMNRNSVAQLISRARINLRGALRGEALAAIIPNAPQCERAVPLIGAEEDGELDPGSTDAEWLADHLVMCETCRVRREAMAEAGISYRAWLPISAGPFLFRETMAEAAELVGADWSGIVARRESARSVTGGAARAAAARAPRVPGRRCSVTGASTWFSWPCSGWRSCSWCSSGPRATTLPSPRSCPLPTSSRRPRAGRTRSRRPSRPRRLRRTRSSPGGDKSPAAAAPAGEAAEHRRGGRPAAREHRRRNAGRYRRERRTAAGLVGQRPGRPQRRRQRPGRRDRRYRDRAAAGRHTDRPAPTTAAGRHHPHRSRRMPLRVGSPDSLPPGATADAHAAAAHHPAAADSPPRTPPPRVP